jgi:transposase InsO family protein
VDTAGLAMYRHRLSSFSHSLAMVANPARSENPATMPTVLEHYYFPWELENAIAQWVAHYNHERYHESLDNVTPADVYNGRRNDILDRRSMIKSRTLTQRKVQNLRLAG